MHARPNPSLSDIVERPAFAIPRRTARVLAAAAAVAGVAVCTWAAAQARIPLQPVPITLQTLVVLLAGALIGSNRGLASQMVYLGMGISGVPLFAGGVSGFAVISGPTGGYLLGFAAAAFVVGRWIGARARFARAIAVFSAGALVILILGTLHLALFYTHDLWAAARVGLLPFLPGDAAKVIAAASIYCSYRRLRTNGGFSA